MNQIKNSGESITNGLDKQKKDSILEDKVIQILPSCPLNRSYDHKTQEFWEMIKRPNLRNHRTDGAKLNSKA